MKKALVAVWTALLVVSSVNAQTDDFNDGNDTGWTRYNPLTIVGGGATYSFPAGGYRLNGPASPNPGAVGPSRSGSTRNDVSYTNFRITFDLVDWNNTADQAFGALGRVSQIGLGSTDGYAFTYATDGSIDLSRINDEDPTGLGSTAIVLNPANDYRFVFEGVGSSFQGQVFDLGNLVTPLATVNGTDATFASGFNGFVVFDNTTPGADGITDATFDNYSSVVPVPEPSTYALMGLGALVFALRRFKKS